jgi:hypothetical protein
MSTFLSHNEKNETNSEKINKVRYYQARNLHRTSIRMVQQGDGRQKGKGHYLMRSRKVISNENKTQSLI